MPNAEEITRSLRKGFAYVPHAEGDRIVCAADGSYFLASDGYAWLQR